MIASQIPAKLVAKLPPSENMTTKGFDKSDPRVPGDSEEARAANRRVEIGIVDSRLLTNGELAAPE